jgi:hypothetical protein
VRCGAAMGRPANRVGAVGAQAQPSSERRSAPTGPSDAAVSRDPGTPDAAPDDADDLRRFHFDRLIRRRSTLAWGGIPTVVIAIGLFFSNPLLTLVTLVLGFLTTIAVCWSKADSQAEDDFFVAYAEERGLTRTKDGSLPGSTPLLRKGDKREADEVLEGSLGDGISGRLALYTYTDVWYDKNGRHETDYRFTVAISDVPECRQRLPGVYANRKFGFRVFEHLEDVFRTKERVKLESGKLDDEYEIFADKDQDQNFLRQLFSPTFIVWMTDEAPEKFAFELEDGVLCCNVRGHKKSAAELDGMRGAAAHVASRLRDEVREGATAPSA